MSLLAGKKILLGVSGSIAAYKSTFVIRELIKAGAEVQVVLTPSALSFVTPLTLATLSKRPVFYSLIENPEEGIWTNHVELGLWADLFLIAPGSANTLAKMAQGISDNLLLITYLSARCPVFFAPAMDLDMHEHAANQTNIKTLEARGDILIPAERGELASGLEGTGRMAEPQHIVSFLEAWLADRAPLRGKRVLVNAGPTQEPIDPVRYIGNRSSGKMGFALAAAAAALGAEVTLVSGPVHLADPPNVQVIRVTTAKELFQETTRNFPGKDIAILSAAVADYRPSTVADEKIKKSEGILTLTLEKTEDILAHLGEIKTSDQTLVGFALETQNEAANAREKLIRKKADLIVLNSLNEPGAAFGHDTNKVTLISHNKTIDLQLMPKEELATVIFNHIKEHFL